MADVLLPSANLRLSGKQDEVLCTDDVTDEEE